MEKVCADRPFFKELSDRLLTFMSAEDNARSQLLYDQMLGFDLVLNRQFSEAVGLLEAYKY
jgi:hypothetical protein